MARVKKKLMLLGGLRYLLPVIEVAHRQVFFENNKMTIE